MSHAAAAELNLHDYWRIIRRRKGLLLLSWGLVMVATAVFTQIQTPIYQSRGTIKIERSNSIPGVGLPDQYDTWTIINTEVKSVRSINVASLAVEKLGWVSPAMPRDQAVRVATNLLSQVQSERLGDSNLIQVSVQSDNPKKAAAVANAVIEAYITKSTRDRNQKTREVREFTFQEMQKAEAKLRTAEDTQRLYTEKSGAHGLGNYLSTELISLQTRLDELLKDYTDQHPEVRGTKAKIAAVEKQMKHLPEAETEFMRLSREVRINEELYTLLAKRYKEAQISESERDQVAFIDSPAVVPERPIRPNKQLNMITGMFVGLLFGLTLVFILENLDTSIDTIEDLEDFMGLSVLSVIPHIEPFTTEARHTLFNIRLPKTDGLEENRNRLVIFHASKSSFVESYHTLRTNLKMEIKSGARPGVVLGFTSAGISEGKTITGANFALTAAQHGIKTLFVEADLRRPAVHRLMGVSREPGLTDCVMSARPWQEAIRGTSDFLLGELGAESVLKTPGIENFRLFPSGPSPMNPADILGSPHFDHMIREMRQQFDLIILDCPPVMLFADALLIGPKTDGIILVYKAGRTARGALKRAKDQLINVKTKVIGVVLNDLRTSDMEPRYGYYYYSYKYEAEEEPPTTPSTKAR